MPWVFRAMEVRRSDTDDSSPAFGYIRIFSFNVPNATAFVDEFARLAGLLPGDGLIIDVRGNGGGLIYAAEQLLQLLTPREIEPQSAQFVNTPLNLRICRKHRRSTTISGLVLEPWIESIEQATRTAATFSRGFPITGPHDANSPWAALPRACRPRHRRAELLGHGHVRRWVPGPRSRSGDRGRRGDRRRRRQRVVAWAPVRTDAARRDRRRTVAVHPAAPRRRPARRRAPHDARRRAGGQRARGPRRHAGGRRTA